MRVEGVEVLEHALRRGNPTEEQVEAHLDAGGHWLCVGIDGPAVYQLQVSPDPDEGVVAILAADDGAEWERLREFFQSNRWRPIARDGEPVPWTTLDGANAV